MARVSAAQAGGSNVFAFLDMLAWSEGASTIKSSDDGYKVLVGGTLFSDYSKHPVCSFPCLAMASVRRLLAGISSCPAPLRIQGTLHS